MCVGGLGVGCVWGVHVCVHNVYIVCTKCKTLNGMSQYMRSKFRKVTKIRNLAHDHYVGM